MIDPVYQTLVRIEATQKEMVKDIEEIKKQMVKLPCEINTYKVNLLQKIVFGCIIMVLMAFMGGLINPQTSIVKAKQDISQAKKQ